MEEVVSEVDIGVSKIGQVIPNEIVRKKEPLPESFISYVEDEFSNVPGLELKPLQEVILKQKLQYPKRGYEDVNVTEIITQEFDYRSRTTDLEINSERTRLLQEQIVDKMIAGTDLKTQIVIMNKGIDPSASVAPDGTIFISQSLLNKMESFDEVAAVIGHELGHLLFKTAYTASKSAGQFGVSWMHEEASDAKSIDLLEKAGFNSLAFSTAIQRISENSRGTVHQSGLARASHGIGQHMVIDRETSSKELTSVPDMLKSENVRPTNLEIFQQISNRYLINLKNNNEIAKSREVYRNEIRTLIPLLHPADLQKIYSVAYYYSRIVSEECEVVIRDRLSKQGFTQNEIELFLICENFTSSNYNSPSLKTPEEAVTIVEAFEDFDKGKKMHEMNNSVFGTKLDKDLNSVLGQFTRFITDRMYDYDLNMRENGFPVTHESIVDVMELIRQWELPEGRDEKYREYIMRKLAEAYIEKSYVAYPLSERELIDKEQITSFLKLCLDRGITFSKSFDLDINRDKEIYFNGDKLTITAEAQDIVGQAFDEVYRSTLEGEENSNIFSFEEIDEFLKTWSSEGLHFDNRISFGTPIHRLRKYLDKNNVSDSERITYLQDICSKVDELPLKTKVPLLRVLEEGGSLIHNTSLLDEFDSSVAPLMKFNLKLAIGLHLFKEDGKEFYDYMNGIMTNPGFEVDDLSYRQLVSLCQGIFAMDSKDESGRSYIPIHRVQNIDYFSFIENSRVNLKNYSSYLDLPFIKKIIEKSPEVNYSSWKEVNEYIENTYKPLVIDCLCESFSINGEVELFDESLITTLAGRNIRANVEQLLLRPVTDTDLPEMMNFIDRYYPSGPAKSQIVREIHKRVLESKELSWDERVEYVITHYDHIGPQGMERLAEEIEDFSAFEIFHERMQHRINSYLEGSEFISGIAMVDNVSIVVASSYDEIFRTAILKGKDNKITSTQFAKAWFSLHFLSRRGSHMPYDREKGKFVLDGTGEREAFRSFSDVLEELHELTPVQRFAIVLKSLTEVNGAFSSSESRKKLGELLTESLGLKEGFLADVLQAASTEADPKLVSFPVASMLGPLLFRGLDQKNVDIQDVEDSKVRSGSKDVKLSTYFSRDEIIRILNSDTRSITVFGAQYQKDPDSAIAKLVQENDAQYENISKRLQGIFGEKPEGEVPEPVFEIDAALDSVLKGVESGGPLGIRTLQLTTQFHSFEPNVERRLSNSFDRNRGMSKLVFWKNLYNLAQKDPSIRDFLGKVKIREYLGGGSLQTTYSAEISNEDGSTREVIIKQKNPNIEAFIQEAYSSVHLTLDALEKKGGRKNREYARSGKALIDLAQKWCLDDINDTTFVKDDDTFRTTVSRFNAGDRVAEVYVPERVLTQKQLKSEDLAGGRTVNQFLNDESVEPGIKQKVVKELSRFFLFQMKQPVSVDEQGRPQFLIHSDPHIGNYMVDLATGKPRLGVIDRSLYLHLAQEDINVLQNLIVRGNNTEFVESFIDRVLDLNKVRGRQRVVIKGTMFSKLAAEAARQMARGGVNRFALMRTMMTEFSNKDMDIPLNLRLMIRNVGAFQELARRYNIDLESLYKETMLHETFGADETNS